MLLMVQKVSNSMASVDRRNFPRGEDLALIKFKLNYNLMEIEIKIWFEI